jgi:Protein of unknown function (DUF4238)
MTSNPRMHHLVPAFYLKGFTVSGCKDGKLFVFDYLRNKHYSTTPGAAGRRRDYFRHYEPEGDQFEVEKELAELEGAYDAALAELISHGRVKRLDHVDMLVKLAALIQSKTERTRAQLERLAEDSIRKNLASGKVTSEQWNGLTEERRRAGVEGELPDLTEATRLSFIGEWAPPVARPLLLGQLGETQEFFYRSLCKRKWELQVADPRTTGYFITSDSPLCWGTIGDDASIEDQDTEVTFPVSKSHALVSYLGARSGNFAATREIVAHVNARTLFMSTGTAYFADEDFWLEQGDGARTSRDYFVYVRLARARGMQRP